MPDQAIKTSIPDVLDVAIVGGGVSGAYCAWRLKEAMPGSKIGLFEGSDRIGGRLLSLTPPGAPHLRAEMGGMVYFTSQKLVRSLVENKLGLAHEILPPESSSLAPAPKNLIYLRGVRLDFAELSDPAKVPYRLAPSEQGVSWQKLMTHALRQLFPKASGLSGKPLQLYLQQAMIDNLPLWRWGFWNILSRVLSQEAYSFVRDILGYESMLQNYNAVDGAAQFLDLGDLTLNRVIGGYQQLPLTLCKDFDDAGGKTYLRYRLRAVDTVHSNGADLLELKFAANSSGWGPGGTGDTVTLYAKRLILAMPQRSLQLLDQSGPIFGSGAMADSVRSLLGSVTALPMFKTYLCYSKPWWEPLGFATGKAVTDLPLRQCFYWGVEGEQPGADKSNRNSLLMASYTDCGYEPYWGGLCHLDIVQPPTSKVGAGGQEHLASHDWDAYRAPITAPLVNELQRQLSRIHGITPPDPYDAAFMDWGTDPFGGAAHCWNIHVKSWEVTQAITQPLKNMPVYICGEAFSSTQGYVEGALETAESVMQKYFGLSAPDWITPKPKAVTGASN
jgi:monoamine oxidase